MLFLVKRNICHNIIQVSTFYAMIQFHLLSPWLLSSNTFLSIFVQTQIEDNTMLVRALDKFYRKVQSVHQLMPESGMDRTASNIVAFSAHNRVAQYTNYLQDQLYGNHSNSSSVCSVEEQRSAG